MAWRLITIGAISIPLAIGMGKVVSAMFPAISSNVAGLVGGAVAVPIVLFEMAAGAPD